ncbi:hypothetical protein BIV23_15660 [Streptomyces monashensis]|uniref:Uncharacterized protein n=1 Tax=Streptomyces monashensis TaxID=1678012 RepID=A0A1S2QH54_9ACTN|nr:hypothetical protein BIV23_15660 [Streptomyces monashensis]
MPGSRARRPGHAAHPSPRPHPAAATTPAAAATPATACDPADAARGRPATASSTDRTRHRYGYSLWETAVHTAATATTGPIQGGGALGPNVIVADPSTPNFQQKFDDVFSHQQWCAADPSIVRADGFEAPATGGIGLHDPLVISLGGNGQYAHVVNGTGAPTSGTGTAPSKVTSFP